MSESTSPSSNALPASNISFYSISSPALVSRIQNKIRVQWHWDRDDEVDPRSADPTQLMQRGCHMIVQMQVADNQNEDRSTAPSANSSENPTACRTDDAEEEKGDHRPEKKQKLAHLGSTIETQLSDRVSGSVGSPAASVPGDRICNLNDVSEKVIWSSVLTPTVLSRATILLPHSARFHRLFYHYYELFIAQQQSEHEWRTSGCPVWLYRFDLNLFHSRLDAMRSVKIHDQQEDEEESSSSITECVPVFYSTPLPASLEWDLIRRWRRKIAPEYDISSIPHRFPIYIANYSNESCSSSSSSDNGWQGDLLVLPLRTIHAVLDASPLVPVMRLKFFLGFYSALPSHQPRDRTGFAIGHGPGRHEAREFERHRVEGDEEEEQQELQQGNGNAVQQHMVQQWKDVKFDKKAWKLWDCESQSSSNNAESADASTSVQLPIGQQVQLSEKSSEELEKQQSQSQLLLQDLERDSCSLLRGVFPPSLQTASKTLQYLHDLMRLPEDFRLTSLLHARAFHDGSLRKRVGLESHHLRRDANQFESTHVQASHGNTAYGAYSAGAVEAALFLEPFVDVVWNKWNLGQGASQLPSANPDPSRDDPSANSSRSNNSSAATTTPPKLFTIEVGYQAPLPLINESTHDNNASRSSSSNQSQSHKRSRSKRN